MTTLVMAHGKRDPQAGELRVPAGTQIDFYADFDEIMVFMNGLAVVARGALGTPNQSYSGDDLIPNYQFAALSSDELGWWLQADRTGLGAWFVGDNLADSTALCTDPDACDETGHACDGVLGLAHASGETHLVVLACRGTDAAAKETHALVGADGQRDDSLVYEMFGEKQRFMGLSEDERIATWAGYPENTKMAFMVYEDVQAWADAYGAKQLLATDGPEAFAVYCASLTPEANALIQADPVAWDGLFIGQSLRSAVEAPDAFAAWFDALDQTNKDRLLQDPGLYAWNQGRGAGAAATPTPAAAALTPADSGAADARNGVFVKTFDEGRTAEWIVGGGIVQLGDGHDDADWVAAQRDYRKGTFEVRRARIGAGRLVFRDVPPVHQSWITAAVKRISDKSVVFE